MEEIIREILDLEWNMMGQMEDAENDEAERPVFEAMRRAQFDAWSEAPAASYLQDLRSAQADGRNLQTAKFTRMLRNIAPEEYAKRTAEFEAVSEEKAALIAEIWEKMKKLNQEFAERYPVLGMSGRPLLAEQEADIPSVETYQCSELETYSMQTLRLFRDFLLADIDAGNNLVEQIQKNTVASMGYKTLGDAERELALAALAQMGGTECSSCGMVPGF